jgi:hypothetical protein
MENCGKEQHTTRPVSNTIDDPCSAVTGNKATRTRASRACDRRPDESLSRQLVVKRNGLSGHEVLRCAIHSTSFLSEGPISTDANMICDDANNIPCLSHSDSLQLQIVPIPQSYARFLFFFSPSPSASLDRFFRCSIVGAACSAGAMNASSLCARFLSETEFCCKGRAGQELDQHE